MKDKYFLPLLLIVIGFRFLFAASLFADETTLANTMMAKIEIDETYLYGKWVEVSLISIDEEEIHSGGEPMPWLWSFNENNTGFSDYASNSRWPSSSVRDNFVYEFFIERRWGSPSISYSYILEERIEIFRIVVRDGNTFIACRRTPNGGVFVCEFKRIQPYDTKKWFQ